MVLEVDDLRVVVTNDKRPLENVPKGDDSTECGED